CCEIKQFTIGIDLPLAEATGDDQTSNQVKTYLIDFGTILACSNTHRQRTFTVENPTALDLRVKLRREGGAIGLFDIDSKQADFFLFAYESKILTIDWSIQDIVQDVRCVYEIYFSKDFKCRIICLGKTRKITYDLIYKSVRLAEKQFRTELEPCLPGTILYEELTVHNTGDVKMTMEAGPENSSASVVVALSHRQVVLEPNVSLTLKIELEVKDAHRTIDNLITLLFPYASQRSSFKLSFKTTAGWPEFDRHLFSSLMKMQVDEEANEKVDKIILYNQGSVKLFIDDLHSTSPHVSIDNHLLFPLTILPRQQIECSFTYKVEKRLASFECDFVLKTNCQQRIQHFPFHCKRMAPIISFDHDILHCGTTMQGSKVPSFSITIKNDGNLPAQLEYEPKHNTIFTFKFGNDEKSIALSTIYPRTIECLVEIKKTAPTGYFK
ncbi:unnamed protein product, partial [Didymodactylos carnosus]